MTIGDSLLGELIQESRTTRRLLERVPGDKLGWRPHAKSFTLGQLALHIAQLPGNIAGFVTGPTLEVPSAFSQAEAISTAQVLTEFEASLGRAKEIVAGLDDATLQSNWSLMRQGNAIMSMPRMAVLRGLMLNHLYHHRGQLSVYLREVDVAVPSIYGPSADENPFA